MDLCSTDEHLASALAHGLRIPHLVARFLVSRGIRTQSEAHHMLCGSVDDIHDPFLMLGMEDAVRWFLDVRDRAKRFSFSVTTTWTV